MVQFADLNISDDHPLVLEFTSLRSAVTRFQDEAHSASIKLQRHSLDTSNAHERVTHLERENALLRSEITVLRANPYPDTSLQSHSISLQAKQLTLSLRRLSDKLSLTEDALQTRDVELAHARSDLAKAKHTVEGAYDLAARTRGREEEGKFRERELEREVRAAEEERKMSDLVVNEYADLVRKSEGRPGIHSSTHSRLTFSAVDDDGTVVIPAATSSSNSTLTLIDSLSEGKLGLQKLLSEFSTETERLQAELFHLHGELATSEAKNEAERKGVEHDRLELAKAKFELEKLKLDDNVAAKMVSRYMQFSQSSTDTLQFALTSLKTRHAATMNTLTTTLSALSAQLQNSQSAKEKLRYALDELGGDIMRESYGRRREVALRIRMLGREESIREELGRWVRRADEAMEKAEEGMAYTALEKMVQNAHTLLATLDNPPNDSITPLTSTTSYPGSLARVIAAQNAVEMLVEELQAETAQRLELERVVASGIAGVVENGGGKGEGESGTERDLAEASPFSPDPPKMLEPFGEADTEKLFGAPKNGSLALVLSPMEATSQPALGQTSNDAISGIDTLPNGNANDPKPTQDFPLSGTSPTGSDPPLPDATPPSGKHVEEIEVSVRTPSAQSSQRATEQSTSTPSPGLIATLSKESAPENPHVQVPKIIRTSGDILHQPLPRVPIVGTLVDEYSPHAIQEEASTAPLVISTSSSAATTPSKSGSTDFLSTIQDAKGKNSTAPPRTARHPLLAELARVSHRYDDLQRAFRDCHLALQDLRKTISNSSKSSPATSKSSRSTFNTPQILQTALERLDDYNEDARVELEIRTADEALLARGFETLLSVPGALPSTSSSTNTSSDGDNDALDSKPTQSEIELQIKAFTSGTDTGVQKALQGFTRKLDDIQHDIAALKHAVHAPDLSPSSPTTPSPVNDGSGGWTSWIRSSPSRSGYPAPGLGSGPAPTFGNIMTTPRLRHSSSLNFYGHPRKGSAPNDAPADPFAGLGLRLPMPSYVHVTPTAEARGPRPRTLSAMYMLGLGSRNASGSFMSMPQHTKVSVQRNGEDTETETEADGEIYGEDTDVE